MMIAGSLLLGQLVGCGSRSTPAPVENLYQGKSFQDFQKDSYDGHSYQVQKGDTLFSIAWYTGNDYRDLARINKINAPYPIYPGQLLRLKSPQKLAQNTNQKKSGQTSATLDKSLVDQAKKQAYGNHNKTKKRPESQSERIEFPDRISRWVWPAKGKVSAAHSVAGQATKGIEISGKAGDAIYSAADGKVVYTGSALRGYGQLVIIKHSDNFLSAYAHNTAIHVNEQQWVKVGQKIASMGDTGTDQVKLRFEVRYKGKSVDPKRYLPKL